MAYKVLYRKYRPQDFNSLYGQENIKKILIDSIKNEKLAHAYLFSGPRGTGKTSTAKLFAKTINCENQADGIPCNKCKSCINYEQSADIIEIDAASNNGVDEIRDLRENAKVLPTYSKYKIYIIDEVHMLSQSAWNAFLKILEEPPKHVIFILATTELQKIPITILSRCQRFNFQRIDVNVIKENILRIAANENISITEEASEYLANLADGGMRDALSLLDQLSKENEEITKDMILKTFGILTENEVKVIFNALSQKNVDEINTIFDEYLKKGLDVNLLISKIINYLYEIELEIFSGKKFFMNIEDIKQMASELITCYNKSDGLTLIKIILFSYIVPQNSSESISREIISEEKETKLKAENTNKTQKEKTKIITKQAKTKELIQIRINNSFVGANKQEKEKFKKSWQNFIEKETLQNNGEILSILEDTNIEVVSSTNVLFSNKSSSTVILFNNLVDYLEQEFTKLEKQKINFICIEESEWLKEKQEFIANKNKKYEYIKENQNEKSANTIDSATFIFDKEIIEID